jgi:FlaA1/EpsC-like NDP-sugar epimerase
VSLVLQAATLGDAGQIFMLDMGEPVKILELAHDLIRLSNRDESEVSIVFVGLRPGEKLFEEIRLHGESIRPTIHPRIVITEAPQPESGVIARWLAAARSDHNMTAERAIAHLQALVAEYRQPPTDSDAHAELFPAGALPEPAS